MKGKVDDEIYFDRDEKGALIPKPFKIDLFNDEIMLIPLCRGEIKTLLSGMPDDYEKLIILRNVKYPVFTDEEVDIMKTEYINVIVNKVFEISGIVTNKKSKRKETFEKEDEFGKKLKEIRERKKEGDMILFLHEIGYNFFTVNKLVSTEIGLIVECWNARESKKKVNSKFG